jgi:hypothetical protein
VGDLAESSHPLPARIKPGTPSIQPSTCASETDANQGHGFVVRTNEPFDYNGAQTYFKSIYWHLVDFATQPQFKPPIATDGTGTPIKAGDLLGYADNTGVTSGDHLHFGLKPQAPGEDNGLWYNVAQNNGYLGAIDPTPYFNGLFAQDIPTLTKLYQALLTALQHMIPLLRSNITR